MRNLFLFLMMIVGTFAMAAEPSVAYLQTLIARTLGFPKVEFYEAFVVTSSRKLESTDTLLELVRPLCSEFPKLDSYLVRVFSDAKWAKEQAFDWGIGPQGSNVRADLADIYMAEIRPDGTLTLFPYRSSPTTVNIGRSWCSVKRVKGAGSVSK